MTESKIVVPEKMLKAASAAMRGPITNLSDFLEAALRWLSGLSEQELYDFLKELRK